MSSRLLNDEEINRVIEKCDYEDSFVSCPMPITPLRYERAVAQAQLDLDKKECRERVRERTKEIGEWLRSVCHAHGRSVDDFRRNCPACLSMLIESLLKGEVPK